MDTDTRNAGGKEPDPAPEPCPLCHPGPPPSGATLAQIFFPQHLCPYHRDQYEAAEEEELARFLRNLEQEPDWPEQGHPC